MPPGMPMGMPGMPGMPDGNPASSGNAAVDQANAALLAAAQATLPQGSFDPRAQPDIAVWAHDVTVQPGKTYRYQLSYIIANPVFLSTHVCKPASLAAQFALVSIPSPWTEAISVKSETNFFAISTSPNRDTVKFEIFRWKGGNWQVATVDSGPGDMVGAAATSDAKSGPAASAPDFTTGWTMVDVRPDPNPSNVDNRVIILTSDNGQTLRKNLRADQQSAELKRLSDLVNAAKAAPAGGPASPGAQAGAAPTGAFINPNTGSSNPFNDQSGR